MPQTGPPEEKGAAGWDAAQAALPAIGAAVGPIGAAVGGLASGIIGMVRAGKAKKRATDYENSIPEQDAGQVAHLAKIRRERGALQAGTDPITQLRLQQIRQRTQQTSLNLARSSGGNAGGLVSNMLRAQAAGNSAGQEAGAWAYGQSMQLLGQEGMLVNSMANRLYQQQLAKRNRLFSEAYQKQQDANDGIAATIGQMGKININKRDPSPSPTTFNPLGGGTAQKNLGGPSYGPFDDYDYQPPGSAVESFNLDPQYA